MTQSLSRKLSLFVAVLAVSFGAKSAFASFQWVDTDTGIVCGQVAGDGSYTPVDDAPCMKAQPPIVEWQSSHGQIRCAEETPQGGLLQFIDSSFCIKRLQTTIGWGWVNGQAVCSRLTSSGAAVAPVDPAQCAGMPQPTAPPAGQPPVVQPPDNQPTNPSTPQGAPGFHWSDANHTSCILYGTDGFVRHLAPPASCAQAQ